MIEQRQVCVERLTDGGWIEEISVSRKKEKASRYNLYCIYTV